MFKPLFKGHVSRCCFCSRTWGRCTCDFRKLAPFDFGGLSVTDPNLSECKRYFVDPDVYYGKAWKESAMATGLRLVLWRLYDANGTAGATMMRGSGRPAFHNPAMAAEPVATMLDLSAGVDDIISLMKMGVI